MAKEKKNVELSAEERLEAALVPNWEQPYKVPDNWCWVYLRGVLREIKNGTTIKQDKSGIGYSVTRIESLQNQTIDFNRLGNIVDESAIRESDWYNEGDIALSHINSAEHVGKTALITKNMLPLVHGMNLLRLRFSSAVNPTLFQYYSQSYQYKEAVLAKINMAINQVSINQKQIGLIEYPLPPLIEQQRIVDRIKSLFAKLDEAKEKAQSVVDGFEVRKAAILHKAFTGELTAKWRAINNIADNSWSELRVIDVLIEKPRNGYSPTPVSYATNCKSMTLSATTSGIFKPEYFKYIDEIIEADSYLWLKPGDILIQRANSLEKVGTSAIYTGAEHEFIFPDLMMKLQVTSDCLAEYLAYQLKTNTMMEYFRANATGTAGNMPKINQKVVSEAPILVPTLDEQREIVRILDGVLVKEQKAKEMAEATIISIDTMKKTILARAFRGELGTNDPADESAEELLKRIL